MKLLSMFLGILIAFLGAVSAISIGTPTTPENATRASVGPRRNGFSDLPSSVSSYNTEQYWNAIPEYVMANDPATGNDAIIYTREEIFTAMQQGYEVLQRTRDPAPGPFVMYGNIQYPSFVYYELDNLRATNYGRFLPADADLELYAWPLLWTNSYTGFNQNPGQDRVVFNQDGIYLGVITRRLSDSQPDGGFRWCPPTNGYGGWIARWIGGFRGWDWTGVPPDGGTNYHPPSRWNIASSQRNHWAQLNPGGMLPVGSDNAQVNSSNLATADMTPPDALFDDDNPLQFPPWDNSTGTLVTYVPSNNSIDGNLTNQFEAADCTFARDHGAQGYHQSCQTRFPGGQSMQVRITISGTGQETGGWCQGIMDNMHKQCGGHFSLLDGIYSCNKRYPGTATFSKATDPSDTGYGKMFFGVDLHFWLQWPWEQSDADHKCIASSVEIASCGGSRVKSFNGKWCRNIYWKPSPPLFEWSNDMGVA